MIAGRQAKPVTAAFAAEREQPQLPKPIDINGMVQREGPYIRSLLAMVKDPLTKGPLLDKLGASPGAQIGTYRFYEDLAWIGCPGAHLFGSKRDETTFVIAVPWNSTCLFIRIWVMPDFMTVTHQIGAGGKTNPDQAGHDVKARLAARMEEIFLFMRRAIRDVAGFGKP